MNNPDSPLISIDEIHEFSMILPTDDSFVNMNFTENMSSKISSVE